MRQFPGEWFSYSLTDEGPESRFRPAPLLPIVLSHRGRALSVRGLIDTGAEVSVLPRPLARRMRLHVGPPDTAISTFGEELPATRVVLGLRVPLAGGAVEIPAADFCVPVAPDVSSVVVLGRHPLMQEAEIRVQEWRQRFALVTRQRAWLV